MPNDKKIHAAKKVFKIDSLSKNLCMKRSTIRNWEKRFNLRATILQAPDKLYTIQDAEVFRSIKRMKIDKQETDEIIKEHLVTLKPAQQEKIIEVAPPETPAKKEPKTFNTLPLDKFLGFKVAVRITPTTKSIEKTAHAIPKGKIIIKETVKTKPAPIIEKQIEFQEFLPEIRSDFVKVPREKLLAIKTKVIQLRQQLFGVEKPKTMQKQKQT
ncbi:MerR family transcriptional regulator [Candidatus Babeliales bacterium]|nr:MerR family transcriptional regulator [Candidatus Babeliales bacterium]